MSVIETTIDLIRHGEPEGGQRIRGTLNDPLSENGWRQMWQAIGAQRPWSRIVSSPMLRCQAFAERLADSMGLTPQIQPDFREIGFGAWEGLSTRELLQQDPSALQRYWQNPLDHAPLGAEPVDDFRARVFSAWEDLLPQVRGEHVLLVCHGGVIRAILSAVLGMPRERLWCFDVPYANLSRIVCRELPDGACLQQLKFHQSALPQDA